MYKAIVAPIHIRPHPNADRLCVGTVRGYQVVTSIEVEDGTLGVFFPTDGQLSEEMAKANDLVRRKNPETGAPEGGFFEENRRVRSQKLRGVSSDGFWTRLDALAFTGYNVSQLKEGDQFDELNGVPICNKYYTPATLRAMKQGNARKTNARFVPHVETAQFRHEASMIIPGSILYFTEKLHGTSGRYGYVQDDVEIPLKWWEKLLGRKPKVETRLNHLHGTRNVIMADEGYSGWYGSNQFRWDAITKLTNNLHPGEVLYYELVGWAGETTPVMARHNTKDLKDIKKQYGPEITYTYGQPQGTCGLFVYRITRVSEDGHVIDLSWPQIKARCAELGLEVTPDIAPPFAVRTLGHAQIYGGETAALEQWVDSMLEGPSLLDENHIREGVVIRVESPDGRTYFLKAKSFSFGVMEGYLKNTEEYIDLEEIS